MKRFWKHVAAVAVDGGWAVEIDGRRVKTPARRELVVPNEALVLAIVDEWAAVGETADPRAMPLTGLANAEVDRVADDPARFAADVARYAESDLTCYRADGPTALIDRQSESWDALLGWARRRYAIDFTTCQGVMHIAQPAETVAKLGQTVAALDPFRLAGLSPLVTIGGSLVAGLAVLEQAVPPEAAWEAVSLDERWQLEQWGADAEGQSALDSRRRDFLAAARFLELLG